MRVYIAGPMTGIPDHNFPAFFKQASILEAAGYDVINPAALTLDQFGTLEVAASVHWSSHMKRDLLALVSGADAVSVLDGWETSRGARLEVLTASELGLRIYDQDMRDLELESIFEVITETSPEAPRTTVEASGARKADAGKPRVDLIPGEPLLELARVLTFGAEKYAAHNWRAGFHWSRIYASALRHMMAFWEGEDTDHESGLLHLAHAMACITFLTEYQLTNTGTDDRYATTRETT